MCPPTRPRVLLADDYPGMVIALERMLAQECEVVGSVSDGAALLEAAERFQPDVIVLDLHMPNVNGLEACRQVRRAMPAIKVVVITAESDEAVVHQAFVAGASAFVAKHAIADDLLPTIRTVYAERRG